MSSQKTNRLPGHALVLEGAAHDESGVMHVWNQRNGRARCECGQLSEGA